MYQQQTLTRDHVNLHIKKLSAFLSKWGSFSKQVKSDGDQA